MVQKPSVLELDQQSEPLLDQECALAELRMSHLIRLMEQEGRGVAEEEDCEGQRSLITRIV